MRGEQAKGVRGNDSCLTHTDTSLGVDWGCWLEHVRGELSPFLAKNGAHCLPKTAQRCLSIFN